MKKIITLGPSGTYSEIAARKIIKDLKLEGKLVFEPSIDYCFERFNETDLLILPFENSIDGVIQRTLDLLSEHQNLFITYETNIPITFSLVSNQSRLEDIENVYVQFKAKNQCLKFLSKFPNLNFLITDSNVTSLNMFEKHSEKSAVVIPPHLINKPYELVINKIEDHFINQTRFVLLTNKLPKYELDTQYKVLLTLLPQNDKPGLLYELLANFNALNINLSSIISRPLKNKIGAYQFFIELDINSNKINDLFVTLKTKTNLESKILGIY